MPWNQGYIIRNKLQEQYKRFTDNIEGDQQIFYVNSIRPMVGG